MSGYTHCMSEIVKVYASKINNSNIYIFKDDIVTIEANSNMIWNDFIIKCNAIGWDRIFYKLKFIQILKDIPNENFMKLCAKVGNSTEPIGNICTFTAKEDGMLKLFANDIFFLRWNNSGYINVKISIKRPI